MPKVEKMPTHSEVKSLPYSANQMYNLVADVEKYSEFLPWCAAARIHKRYLKDQCEILEADLVISFKVFREKFGSRVTLWQDSCEIDTEYLDGPFKYMKSNWAFSDTADGCQVEFFVDFELKNAILQRIIGVVFNEAMQRVVNAFEDRAAALYGYSGAQA